jgi:Ca2+:H+ antiporter
VGDCGPTALSRLRLLLPELSTLSVGAGVLALLTFTGVLEWLLAGNASTIVLGLILLGSVVVLLSLQVARQAELLAEELGEPFGTLVLTGSVIVIELALIGSTMLTGESNPTLARDSMFSVLMVALTGITGLCMGLTSRMQKKNRDQPMRVEDLAATNQAGAMVYYNLIGTMSVLVLIIPNFSNDSPEGNFSLPLNIVLSITALVVYGLFLFNQTGAYRDFFVEMFAEEGSDTESRHHAELEGGPWQAAALLMGTLAIVVVIAESMGQLIERGVNELNLPSSLAGILVAMLILLPEAFNAIQATLKGKLQRALNTLYGSVLSTISLTVPAVLLIGEVTGTKVILGLEQYEMVLLSLTLFLLRPHSRVLGSEGLMLLVVFLFWFVLELV